MRAQFLSPLKAYLHRLNQARILQPDFPFQPGDVPFFYGWVILAVTTLGIIMSIPGQTAGVSVFTDHLLTATGLSRLALSNAYLIGTLTSGLLLPFGGVFIDRFGARMVVVGASIWLAMTLIYLSLSDRIAQWISTTLALESSLPIAFGLLCIGFISLRFSGQGMLTLVSRTTLGKWFDRRRGMASGTSGVFTSFGFSAAPLLLSFFIDGFGWQGAWLSLALLVGCGMATMGWLFYRDNPEECGLVMDGRVDQPARTTSTQSVNASVQVETQPQSSTRNRSQHSNPMPYPVAKTRDFTRSEALQTLAFWAVTLALASQALTITGITFHIVDIGAAADIPQKQTVAIFLPIAMFSTITGYLIGVVSDRVKLRLLFIGMMVFEAIGIASVAHLDSLILRLVTTLGLGISGGCFGTLSTVTMPRYFGRQHLGEIAGVEMMTLVIASAIGPSLLAMFNALFGSYQWGLYFCSGMPLAIIFVLIPSQNPQEEQT
ncbi:MAG: MFS transporter [Cyanobacteria bacterium P01_F01_bin.86]